jgi:3-hydroxyisobutyrate dehydrogenase
MADERIGVVGPGRMGLAMVKHLIAKGYDVAVTDISPEQVAKAEALGATGRANAADLGKDRSIVIIAVGFDEETIDATLGKNGLLETMQPGTVIAISSTSSPDTVRMIATKAAEKGIEIYDAPTCRGRRAADDGTLLAVVGGSDEVVARVAPVFSCFCSDIVHLGVVGNGQIGKAINNLVHWVNGLMLIEAGNLATAHNIDLQKLRSAMSIATGKSAALEQWNTMTFTWAQKDMQIVQKLTDSANMGGPMIGLVREMVKEGRKLKAAGDVPDWTGLGTDLS